MKHSSVVMRKPSPYVAFFQDLQWLRFFCIGAIFLMHTAITYSHVPALFDYWYFQSNQVSIVLTGICSFANSACMPLFFLMSGMVARKSVALNGGRYFLKRVKKWLLILCVFWPVTAYLVLSAHQGVVNYLLDFSLLLFPNSLPNQSGFVLPFHQFHLWFLVALLLVELTMYFVYKAGGLALWRPLVFGFLILLHAIVIYKQNHGYLLTPVFWDSHSIYSLLVYSGYYVAGFYITPESWNGLFDKVLYPKILSFTTLIGYFGAKYLLIQHPFFQYSLIIQFIVVLLDASLPIVVFLMWKFSMKAGILQRLIQENPGLNTIKNVVINHALWIYLIQIPVIFLVLAFLQTIQPLVILDKSIRVDVTAVESNWAFVQWLFLSVFSAGMVGLIIYVKKMITSQFNRSV